MSTYPYCYATLLNAPSMFLIRRCFNPALSIQPIKHIPDIYFLFCVVCGMMINVVDGKVQVYSVDRNTSSCNDDALWRKSHQKSDIDSVKAKFELKLAMLNTWILVEVDEISSRKLSLEPMNV